MGRLKKTQQSLEDMKHCYKNAKNSGDREEEARWANQIGHAYKDRGEYVEALKWFRVDYDISSRHMDSDPAKLMPTCQSLGEVYLRLENFEEALTYQVRHFQLAETSKNLLEQQRSSTQLGRTHMEVYEHSDTLSSLQAAKMYFEISIDLARSLRATPFPDKTSSSAFVKEHVDAINNMGLLKMVIEDYPQALKLYHQGLQLCDEEELDDNDDARSRIHHNLGQIYSEQRLWDKAREHINIDIGICQRIPHPQGEAKGWINLGQIHFKLQDYDQATRCYKRALQIAQSLEDEDNLVITSKQNIEVVEKAKIMMRDLQSQIQRHMKLKRKVDEVLGSDEDRKHFRQELKALNELTETTHDLQAWEMQLHYAKRLKSVVKELGDQEKLGDALELIGLAYYNMRKFDKAKKWHQKSWEVCKRVGHLEGVSVAKINYGNALDASGKWKEALQAYKEAYEICSSEGSPQLFSQQINALENMHYCYFVRLEQFDDARDIDVQIQRLKLLGKPENKLEEMRISETDSDAAGSDEMADDSESSLGGSFPVATSRTLNHPSLRYIKSNKRLHNSEGSSDDNVPLSSLRCSLQKKFPSKEPNVVNTKKKQRLKRKLSQIESKLPSSKNENMKRNFPQIVLSDDEERNRSLEIHASRNPRISKRRQKVILQEDSVSSYTSPVVSSAELISTPPMFPEIPDTSCQGKQNFRNIHVSKCSILPLANADISSKQTPSSPHLLAQQLQEKSCSSSHLVFPEGARKSGSVTDVIEDKIPEHERSPVQTLQSVVALHLRERSPSLTSSPSSPVIKHDHLPPQEAVHEPLVEVSRQVFPRDSKLLPNKDGTADGFSYPGSMDVPLVARYMAICAESSVAPNVLLINKLKALKASEDEVDISGCGIQDKCARPLLDALRIKEAFSVLDMSHNSLGNATVHGIKELIQFNNQKDLGLTLDLHCNELGAGALLQICHCPVSLARLEILNLSNNHLTDAVARHLAVILEQCKALVALHLESCGLTTRTIIRISNAIHSESGLAKLCIGNNNPIAGYALADLLQKLATLTCFTELDIRKLELDGTAVASINQLLRNSRSISSLGVGGTDLHDDGALSISNSLAESSIKLTKLDISSCGFSHQPGLKLCLQLMSIQGLTSLNLSGNMLDYKAAAIIALGLGKCSCRLKFLDLSKCPIGTKGILDIIHHLKGNNVLLELKLAETLLIERRSAQEIKKVLYSHGCEQAIVAPERAVAGFSEETSNDLRLQSQDTCRDEKPITDPLLDVNSLVEMNTGGDADELERLKCPCLEISPGKMQTVEETVSGPGNQFDSNIASLLAPQISSAGIVSESCMLGDWNLTPVDLVSGSRGGTCESTKIDIPTTNSNVGNMPFLQELAVAIADADGLQLLDLSDNSLQHGWTKQLYTGWSEGKRQSLCPLQHLFGSTVHFFVKGRPCCSSRPLCCSTR